MLHLTETIFAPAILLIAAMVATAQQPPPPDNAPVVAPTQPETLPAPATQPSPASDQSGAPAPVPWGATFDEVPDILRTHLSASMPSRGGVLVRDVEAGSPAQNAGLQPTDVVLQFNDSAVTSPQQLDSLMAENGAQPAHLQILQAGERRQLQLNPQAGTGQSVVGEPPEEAPPREGLREPAPTPQRYGDQAPSRSGQPAWGFPPRRGSSVFSYDAQMPNGTFSYQGTDAGSTLRADYWDRDGHRRRIMAEGAARDMDAHIEQLPEDMRNVIRDSLSRQRAWDSWFSENLPSDNRLPKYEWPGY